MITVVADTHALVWAYLGDPRLSVAAREAFGKGMAGISAISLAEVLYLEEKGQRRPLAPIGYVHSLGESAS